MDSGMPMPAVARGGKVLIPDAWQCLAMAVVEDANASLPARELAQLVLEAAAAPEPSARSIDNAQPEWVPGE